MVSSATRPTLEDTAAAAESPKMFQLYIRGDWAWVTGMIDRIKAAGYQGFCLTVDSALYSRRERPMSSRWSVDHTRAPQHREWQAKVTWDDVVRRRDYAGLPFLLKGIMAPDDAALAVQHGVDAVWVSNHGGRQLDHGEGTLDVLPEIMDVVGDAAEVVVDGGILRGTDVIKALALGARAVAIGKLQGWGLADGGQEGVVRVLDILDEELRVSMGLLGVTAVDQLNPSSLRPAHPITPPHEMRAWVHLPGTRLVEAQAAWPSRRHGRRLPSACPLVGSMPRRLVPCVSRRSQGTAPACRLGGVISCARPLPRRGEGPGLLPWFPHLRPCGTLPWRLKAIRSGATPMIIDTHTHVVSSDQVTHPLDPGARGWSTEVSNDVEDLIAAMDRAGVACATLVQPNATYGLDNASPCDSATQYAPRTVAVGILDPAALDAADQLSPWVNERGMQGVRLQSRAEADDPRGDALWQRATSLGVPIAIGGGQPEQVDRMRHMGARHPTVRFAPDHCAGWSGAADKAAMTSALERLAQLPNAYMRLSSTSLGPYADLTPPEQVLFRRVIEAFTPRRVMWGSNFPSSRAGGYLGQVQLGQTALAWLSDDDHRWIMGETAHTLWPMLQGPARG